MFPNSDCHLVVALHVVLAAHCVLILPWIHLAFMLIHAKGVVMWFPHYNKLCDVLAKSCRRAHLGVWVTMSPLIIDTSFHLTVWFQTGSIAACITLCGTFQSTLFSPLTLFLQFLLQRHEDTFALANCSLGNKTSTLCTCSGKVACFFSSFPFQ